MANTLKFGNENWATKKDSILAYNDENANFKPLPFTTSRASTATRVNKAGLLETVASGIPRVDYLGNTKGALLLEPQRRNLLPYSEDFSNAAWSKIGASVVGGFDSPDGGANAFKLVESTNAGVHFLFDSASVLNGSTNYNSIHVKPNGVNWVLLYDGANNESIYFDLQNKVIGTKSSGVLDYSIIELSDGWLRIGFSSVATSTSVIFRMYLVPEDNVLSYTGDGVSGVYLFGAQVEQGSYPTSYIPTNGSTVTRLAESCSQTPPDGVIGQTEGTMFIDVTGETQVDAARYITIGNIGDTTNRLIIYQYSNLINVFSGAGATFNITYNPPSGRLKMALAYSVGDYAFYVNGVQVFTNDNNAVPACSEVSLGMNEITSAILAPSIGYNDVGLYNTRLSNTELVTLTTI